jgi:hypothetical protein
MVVPAEAKPEKPDPGSRRALRRDWRTLGWYALFCALFLGIVPALFLGAGGVLPCWQLFGSRQAYSSWGVRFWANGLIWALLVTAAKTPRRGLRARGG